VVEVSAAIVPQPGVVRADAGKQVFKGFSRHGVPNQCGVELAHIAGVVLPVMDAHGLPVNDRLKGFESESQFGQLEARCGRLVGAAFACFRSITAPDEGGNEGHGHDTGSGQAAQFDEGSFVHDGGR